MPDIDPNLQRFTEQFGDDDDAEVLTSRDIPSIGDVSTVMPDAKVPLPPPVQFTPEEAASLREKSRGNLGLAARTAKERAAEAAYKATGVKLSPESASQALDVAMQLKASPIFVAGSEEAKEKAQRDGMAEKLRDVPSLLPYVEQSPVHAALVADDLDLLKAVQEYVVPDAKYDWHGKKVDNTKPPSPFMAGIADGTLKLWDSIKLAAAPKYGGQDPSSTLMQGGRMGGEPRKGVAPAPAPQLLPEFVALRNEIQQLEAMRETPVPGAETTAGKIAGAIGGTLPGVAALIATGGAGALLGAGEAATAAMMFTQSYGGLLDRGVDPRTAAFGAFAATTVGYGAGQKLVGSLLPAGAVKSAQSAIMGKLQDLLPFVSKLGLELTGHAASGWGMGVGMGMVERLTARLDEASRTGKAIDPSDIVNDLHDVALDSLALLPVSLFFGLGEHYERVGRGIDAQINSQEAGTAAAVLQKVKLLQRNQEEMRKVVRSMTSDNRRELDLLQAARDESVFRGADPEVLKKLDEEIATRDAALYKYVDPESFEKAAQKVGLDPEKMAEIATGQKGALAEAKQANGKLRVPVENWVVDLKDLHADLKDATASTPDGTTFADLKKEGTLPPISMPSEALVKKLGPLIAERTLIQQLPKGEERTSKLAANLDKMRAAVTEEYAMGGGAKEAEPRVPPPEKPPKEPAKVNPEGTRIAPSRDALASYARLRMQDRTIGELGALKGMYSQQAEKAQKVIDKATTKSLDLLSSAEEIAQEGIDAGVRSGEEGRTAAEASEAAREVPAKLVKEVRALIHESVLTRMSAPQGVSQEVANSFRRRLRGVIEQMVEARATPDAIKQAVREQVAEARKAYGRSESAGQLAEDKSVRATEKTVAAGEQAAEIETQKQVRNVNKALEAARAQLDAQGQKIVEKAKGMAKDYVRGLVYKARGVYGPLYDVITEGLNLRKVKPEEARTPEDHVALYDAAVKELIDNGTMPAFDVEHLRSVLETPTALTDMTVAEAANVLKALINIRKLARDASSIYIKGKRLERALWVQNDAVPSMLKVAKEGKQATENLAPGEKGLVQKLTEAQRNYEADRAGPHLLLKAAGEKGEELLERGIHAQKIRVELLKEAHDVLTQASLPDPFKSRLKEKIEYPAVMRIDPKRPKYITRADAMYALGRAGSVEGMRDLAAGWGISDTALHAWFKEALPDPVYWDAVQKMWDFNRGWEGKIAAVKGRLGGVPMELKTPRKISAFGKDYTGGYFPEYWLDEASGPREAKVGDLTNGETIMQAPPHSFLKPKEKFAGTPDVNWDNLKAHYMREAHYIAYAELVHEQARLFGDKSFANAVKDILGNRWYERLIDWHNTTAADRELAESSRASVATNIIYRMTGWAKQGIFNSNVLVATGIVMHGPIAWARYAIPARAMANGLVKAILPEYVRAARANSEVIANREYDSRNRMNEAMAQVGHYERSKVIETLNAPGQAIYHGADHLVTRWIFNAMVEKSQGMPEHSDWSMADHYKFADKATFDIMPPIDVINMSKVQRERVLGLFTIVRNFPNTIWNANAIDNWETKAQIADGADWMKARGLQIGRRAGEAAALALGLYVMGRGGRTDEEVRAGWKGILPWLGRTMLPEAFFGGLLLYPLLENVAPLVVGEKFNIHHVKLIDSPAGEFVDSITRDIGKMSIEDIKRGRISKSLFAALDLAGRMQLSPIPPAMLRHIEGAWEVTRYHLLNARDLGYTPASLAGDASIVGYGPNRRTTNIPMDIDLMFKKHGGIR